VNRVLGGIGARRLVEISNSDSAPARQSAAEAMLLLCGIRGDVEKLSELAQKTEPAPKIARYNELCRFWPEAVGRFHLTAGEKTAPFDANVEQIGCTFYLRLGSREFASVAGEGRQFEIPIEKYCAATGTAVGAQYVRDLMAGQVKLSSPLGVGWEGMSQANLKRSLDGPLPGFLPVQTPPADGSIALPILLRRDAR
jgi:hypothetical protein